MKRENSWSVVFYIAENGKKPVEEFLLGLDEKAHGRIRRAIGQLKERNTQASAPLVKHIEGDIWELRVESDRNAYRILYFFFTEKRIVLLHGFTKKTQKTPRKEIDTAKKRLADYVATQKGAD